MSELSSALTQYLRSLDDSERRTALESALGEVDVVTARAESKKNPASLDAAAALLSRLILDGEDSAEVVKAAKLAAQRAPRNADGNAVALLAGSVVWKVGASTKLAEPYFRRVRRKNPASPALLEFYREVYSEPKDASQLMQVLVQARRAVKDDPAQRFGLAEEMASLAEEKLGSVDRAIEVWRSVLREDGYDPRASQALMRLYRAGEKWTALVELFKDEFERIEDTPENREARIGRLLEIAELYRDQLNLDAMALSTLQRILDIDPCHDASLKALAETYGNAGRWNDLLAVYNRLVDAARKDEDQPRQIDMMLRVARIHLDELSDPKQGLVSLEEVLELDPRQKQARALIARAYELRGDWDALVELYRQQLQGSDEQESCEIRCKVARLYQERFNDEEQAIVAWNEVLEYHGDVDEALAALAGLYEKSSRWAEAAEVLHRQIHGTPDTNRAIELLTHLAALYLDRLGDGPQSLRMWEEVARLAPGHAQAVNTLQSAYISASRWTDLERMYERMERLDDLLDVLMSAAATISDTDEQVKVYMQVAGVCREKLSDAARGTEALEKVLSIQPDNQDVAHRLLPIYHAQNQWDRLIL
ncbi:MAG: tetratricopeptide repeat protein, partial [Nannocystaceae bacterium]